MINYQSPVHLASCIRSFYQSLFSTTSINHFGFIEINRDGAYIHLQSDPKIANSLQDSSQFIQLLRQDISKEFRLFEVCHQTDMQLLETMSQYNIAYVLRYIYPVRNAKTKGYSIRCNYFTADDSHLFAKQYCLNNLGFLKRLCHEFYNRFKLNIEKIERQACQYEAHIIAEKFDGLLDNTNLNAIDLHPFSFNKLPFNLKGCHFLTLREKEIIYLYFHRFTYLEISQKLDISKRTVERHLESIRKKLNCSTTGHIIPILFSEYGKAHV